MSKKSSVCEVYHPVKKFVPCNLQLRDWKHSTIPGLNVNTEERDISIEDAASFYGPPMLNISRPIPSLPAEFVPRQRKIDKDCAMQLVKKKYLWKKKKKQFFDLVHRLNASSKRPNNLFQQVKKSDDINKLPFGIVRLADHLVKNPDKHFKGLYNWYYGNTLTATSLSGSPYLLYAGGEHLNTLCFASFERKRNSVIPKVSPVLSISLPDNGPIYDVIPPKHRGVIGVRQRDRCSFFISKDDDDENIKLDECFTAKRNEHPFVSMDVTFDEFCTVDANRYVQFWNLEYCKYVEQTPLPRSDAFLEDKFVQVKFSSNENSPVYAVIDRHNVYFADRRASITEPCLKPRPRDRVEMCEKMSVLVPSIQENHWYIGLTHSCLLLDVRIGYVQKWTHMLPQAPTVGTAFRLNKESRDPREALLLSTQSTNEIVAIYNEWKGETPSACCFPVSVPNRIDTLHEARVNGTLASPLLQNNTIGLSAYKRKKKIGIFSLVSTGDIFHQYAQENRNTSGNGTAYLTEEELTYLKNWEQKIVSEYLSEKRTLVTTRISDLSELVNYIGEGIEMPTWNTRKPPSKPTWKISKKELESYQDLLAPQLLEYFGVHDMDEWASDDELDDATDPAGKVQIWLSGNSELLDVTEGDMVDDPQPYETTFSTGEDPKCTDSDECSEMSIDITPTQTSRGRRRSSYECQ